MATQFHFYLVDKLFASYGHPCAESRPLSSFAVTTSDLAIYRRAGLRLDEVRRWAAAGVGPYDAEAAASLGLDPSDLEGDELVPGVTLPRRASWVVMPQRPQLTLEHAPAMPDGSTITVSEIADLAGARRSIVSHWRKGKRGFPEPLIEGRSPQYDLASVLSWMEEHGKLARTPDAVWHWLRQVRSLPAAFPLADRAHLRGAVAALVATATLIDDDQLQAIAHGSRGLGQAASEVERSHLEWRGCLRAPMQELGLKMLHALQRRLLPNLVAALHGPLPPAGLLDEALLELSTATTARTSTDAELAEALLELLSLEPGRRILDPACGEAQLLVLASVVGRRQVRLTGYELDPAAAAIARIRLQLRGLDAEIIAMDAFTIGPEEPFAYVVVDPPLQERTAPPSEWLELAARHLARDGTAVVVTPATALKPASDTLSTFLQRGGTSIVHLPSGSRRDARSALTALVLAPHQADGRITIGEVPRMVRPREDDRSPEVADGGPSRPLVVRSADELLAEGASVPPSPGEPDHDVQALELARRLLARLEDAPADLGSEDLRSSLHDFLSRESPPGT